MRLEIYEPEEMEKEEPVRLMLEQEDNEVSLSVVDEDGDCIAALLFVQSDGTIYLYPHVDNSLGFQLDRNGCVKVKKS